MKRLLVILMVAMLFIVGCSTNSPEMIERFKNNQVRIMTDESGNKYTVEHHFGATYVVKSYNY